MFKYDTINERRKVKDALLPLKFYNDKFKVPDPPANGYRIMSLDVALMASTKKQNNDASALFINDVSPVGNTSYQSSFVFGKTFEGMTTDELGITLMQYFNHYKCDYLVLDTNGKTKFYAVLKKRN